MTADETIRQLRSVHVTKEKERELEADGKADDDELAPSDGTPPPLDGPGIKERIIEIAERLPDDLTAAETICEAADHLRLYFLIQMDFRDIREGRALPSEERHDEPVFLGKVPEIGPISGEAFDRMSIKEKLIHTMKRLPDDLTFGQALVEALERLLLMYKLDRSFEQIRNGQTIPHEEVKRIFMERWQR